MDVKGTKTNKLSKTNPLYQKLDFSKCMVTQVQQMQARVLLNN